eukprot:SAG25_NODE_1787_length_2334_cov_2.713647_2_plen_67_part_00
MLFQGVAKLSKRHLWHVLPMWLCMLVEERMLRAEAVVPPPPGIQRYVPQYVILDVVNIKSDVYHCL